MVTILTIEKLLKSTNCVQKKTRPFLSALEKTIENCKTKGSMCQTYRFSTRVSKSDEFNCDDFAVAAYFHTTTAHGLCDIYNPSLQKNYLHSKHPTKINVKRLVNELSTIKNAMCYVAINRRYEVNNIFFHALALEIRTNGFYIYNSFRNAFSNAWFSGITSESLISNLNIKVQNIFIAYKTKCGLGNRLNKFGLTNCLEMWENIFNVLQKLEGVKISGKYKIYFDFVCKDLTFEFKNLGRVNKL